MPIMNTQYLSLISLRLGCAGSGTYSRWMELELDNFSFELRCLYIHEFISSHIQSQFFRQKIAWLDEHEKMIEWDSRWDANFE